MKINKKGFTLIEILVVVLIIGILASIALPQYRRAVTKAKVASVLPLLRAWSQALMVYKLENDSYCPDGVCPNAKDLDVYWPSVGKRLELMNLAEIILIVQAIIGLNVE